MRQSNVDISRYPKFESLQEAVDYFESKGTLEYFGREYPEMYCVYVHVESATGNRYYIDIFDDGRIVVMRG